MRKYINDMTRTDKLLAAGLALIWVLLIVAGVIIFNFYTRYLKLAMAIFILSFLFGGVCRLSWCKKQNMTYLNLLSPFKTTLHYIEGRHDLNFIAFLSYEATFFTFAYFIIVFMLPGIILMAR